MTRAELSQVHFLKKEQKMWKNKLLELENKSLVKGQEISGMPFLPEGNNSDALFELISQKMELESEIYAFEINIEKRVAEIEQYIMTLDDSFLRQIIEYRCCQCKSWEMTAALIGYGTSAESCRKYFDRRYPRKK